MDPGDLHLPAVLDPILTYLSKTLPSPLYNFILNVLSRCLALLSAFLGLVVSLLTRSPTEWNTQTVLPPLISLLAAYLALVSMYRTTAWMLRTGLWFLKWGIILGTLTAGIGWYMGASQTSGVVNSDLISHIGSLVLDTINGHNHNAVGGERESRMRGSPSRGKSSQKRPRVWESFDRHREWQYSEDQTEAARNSDLETLFDNLMDVAGQVLGGESWWSGLRKVIEGRDKSAEDNGRMRGISKSRTRSR